MYYPINRLIINRIIKVYLVCGELQQSYMLEGIEQKQSGRLYLNPRGPK
jgi:hypothetical protein